MAKISTEDIDNNKPGPLIKALTEALSSIPSIPLKALRQALLHIPTTIPASILTKVLAEVIAKHLAQERVIDILSIYLVYTDRDRNPPPPVNPLPSRQLSQKQR